jgi:hypothetical protein
MIDLDIYSPNAKVEMFIQHLKVKFNRHHNNTKIYISTVSPYDDWLYKQYIIYNEKEQKE